MGRTMSRWGLGVGILGALGVSACAADTAQQSEFEDTAVKTEAVTAADSLDTAVAAPTAAAASAAFILGAIKDGHGLPVPGVFVNITGPASHSAVTDSNGIYQFSSVPSGAYKVVASKPGGSFVVASSTATSKTVTAGAAGAEVAFTCNSGCEGSANIDRFKELAIVDHTVLNDARSDNAVTGAPWSFRTLIEQMTPAGTTPEDFVTAFLSQLDAGTVNGHPVDARNVQGGLLQDTTVWPHKNGKVDLAKAPFKLLAIVNRTDLHIVGAGEGRLVYGMTATDNGTTPPSKIGQPFTIIFEFKLPTTTSTGTAILRKDWVNQFHALGSVGFGPTFNAKLQAITDKFTRAGTTPASPNGSSINQVRTNEILFGGEWQLREFHLVNNSAGKGVLKLSTVAQTPDSTLNGDATLASFINSNALKIRHGLQTMQASFVGGQSQEQEGSWAFAGMNPALLHNFAGQTCNGCHSSEVAQIDGFYMITPHEFTTLDPLSNGQDSLAPFILDIELPRRTRFMQNRLACTGSADCSPGAEAFAH